MSVFFVHTASVQTFLGGSSTGDTYTAAADVKGFLDDGLVLVHSASGEQLVQKSIFFAALSNADKFVPETLVTVNGTTAQVTGVRRRDGGSLGLPDHIEVDLA